MILSRGVGVESGDAFNTFYPETRESGLFPMIENKVKEIVSKERRRIRKKSECERDMIFGYSFAMKDKEIEKKKYWQSCGNVLLRL
jgi:hypothetical protein